MSSLGNNEPPTAVAAPALAAAPAGLEGPPRVVLFGLPQAGKTALLAALAQVQKEYPAAMGGELTDASGGLAQQRQLYYEEIPRPTDDETLPYLVHFKPPGRRARPVEAVLVDSDGRAAEEMLAAAAPPADTSPGALPHAVLDADAVVLAVDASHPAEESDPVFAEFGEFLRGLERLRGRRSEVTDLPVFVVLTKCDLLARRQDSAVDWMERIEERKREVAARLQEVLDEPGEARPREFGRLDLRFWATATRRPPLAGSPARPREPYGVAELFRQALFEAQTFRGRRVRAQRRLAWTFGTTSTIAAGLVALSVALLAGIGRHDPGELERRVERYRFNVGTTPATRLGNWPPSLQRRLAEVREIRLHDEFDALPQELRDFVEEQAHELTTYIPYLKKVLATRFPSLARNDRQLNERREQLEKDLPLPREDWAKTGAGLLRQRLLDDFKLLADRADQVEVWYQRQRNEGVNLWTFQPPLRDGDLINWPDWQEKVEKYLGEIRKNPPPAENLPASSMVTPSIVLLFDRVQEARRLAVATIDDLEAMRDIASALGVVEPTAARPDLLAVPRRLGPAEARERYDRLRNHPALGASLAGLLASPSAPGSLLAATAFTPEHPWVSPYPDYREEFTLARVPDAARPAVVQAASNSYRNLLGPIRDRIFQKFRELSGGGAEAPAHWRAVGAWLASGPAELEAYRRLAAVLNRLQPAGVNAPEPERDPVAVLADFLQREQFPLSAKGATVVIPDSWGAVPPDDAVLTVRSGEQALTLRLEPDKVERDRQERRTTYSFAGNLQRLVYRPGQSFEVTLPLRNGRVLTWQQSRTRSYAFEALSQPPRLHKEDQRPQDGLSASGVRLSLEAVEAQPPIPDALPAVAGRPE